MPSVATRLAFERAVGGVDSLAQQIETLDGSALTQGAGDARYVRQDIGAAWSAPTGTLSRSAYASYAGQTVSNPPTQAEMQALDDAVKALSRAVVGLITDLRANGALT